MINVSYFSMLYHALFSIPFSALKFLFQDFYKTRCPINVLVLVRGTGYKATWHTVILLVEDEGCFIKLKEVLGLGGWPRCVVESWPLSQLEDQSLWLVRACGLFKTKSGIWDIGHWEEKGITGCTRIVKVFPEVCLHNTYSCHMHDFFYVLELLKFWIFPPYHLWTVKFSWLDEETRSLDASVSSTKFWLQMVK